MEYRILGKTGLKVSALSFGASSLGSAFRPINEEDGIRAVHLSLDNGINLIDVSPFYGLTKAETVLGKALKGVARDRYIMATKVGRYGHEMKDFDFSTKRVLSSVDESLSRMGLDHVDIIQAHDIEFGDVDQVVNETVPAMRQIVKSGKARFVGITGLPLNLFKYVADRVDIDVILSYCHYELNDTSLGEMIPYLKSKQIGVISASPLGMGLLTKRGTPDWHPAPDKVKQACRAAAEYCQKQGLDIEKIAVQFSLANPDIATTLVGSASSENMRRNIDWANEPLDHAVAHALLKILAPVQGITWSSGRPENATKS